MKIKKWISVFLLLIMSACASPETPAPTETATLTPTADAFTPTPSATLPPPVVRVTHVPQPTNVVEQYFTAWENEDYPTMYALLSAQNQEQITEEDFTTRHLDTLAHGVIPKGGIDISIGDATLQSTNGSVEYTITLHSTFFGDFTRNHQMTLAMESGAWRVLWDESLIFPDLAGGNKFRIVNYLAPRGDIYARDDEIIVGIQDAFALGINPSKINVDFENDMLQSLGQITGYPPEYIRTLYQNYASDADLYVPFTDVPSYARIGAVSKYDAVLISSFTGRYYYEAGTAPQAIGFISAIQPDEVIDYMRQGYQWTERVPRGGVELWGEPYLSGNRGGILYLDDANGNVLQILGEIPARPAKDIYTTIDKDLQVAAQKALSGFSGAIVVLERDTGRVLTMASSPGFNPNLFEPTNTNAVFDSPFLQPGTPLLNRAIEGQYPLGSVFKIITLAAALESGRFTPESIYECGHEFTELHGITLYDWTYMDEIPPSGTLTLPQGLMRSCNPWFWHIGLDLYTAGKTTAIADMARGFGLGSLTGIEIPNEKAGQVPEPTENLDATNLAIGQGNLLVSPLQVARYIAAIGNGGTLYQPQIIEKIVAQDGQAISEFEPIAQGTLPITPETLSVIRGAMREVVKNPRGTAYRTFGAFPFEIAGKTSTSETGFFDPDAWFVVFTDAKIEGVPDIAVVVMVEKVGEGADFAAPIARRILEVYFYGQPRSIFPWEVRIGAPDWLFPEEEETK